MYDNRTSDSDVGKSENNNLIDKCKVGKPYKHTVIFSLVIYLNIYSVDTGELIGTRLSFADSNTKADFPSLILVGG